MSPIKVPLWIQGLVYLIGISLALGFCYNILAWALFLGLCVKPPIVWDLGLLIAFLLSGSLLSLVAGGFLLCREDLKEGES